VSSSSRTTATAPAGAAAPGRPATVTAVAALTALAGILILIYGVYLCVDGFASHPVSLARAETGGAIFAVFGLGIAWAGRALFQVRPWARTPAMLTHLFIVIISYPMFQDAKFGEGLPLAAYGVAGLVLLFVPASHKVLSR
jgi:hypothetical protein